MPWKGRCPGRELTDQRPGFDDAHSERRVFARIDDVGSATQHGDGRASDGQGPSVCGAVDASGKPTDDAEPRLGEVGREAARHGEAGRRGPSRADHRDRGPTERGRIASGPQHNWRVRNGGQAGGVRRVKPRDRPQATHARAGQRRVRAWSCGLNALTQDLWRDAGPDGRGLEEVDEVFGGLDARHPSDGVPERQGEGGVATWPHFGHGDSRLECG